MDKTQSDKVVPARAEHDKAIDAAWAKLQKATDAAWAEYQKATASKEKHG